MALFGDSNGPDSVADLANVEELPSDHKLIARRRYVNEFDANQIEFYANKTGLDCGEAHSDTQLESEDGAQALSP